MTRTQVLPYVSWVLDDALNATHITDNLADIPQNAVLVGWQCGFEPMFIAVIGSTMDTAGRRDAVDADDAVDIARDYLIERNWFSDLDADNEPDYVIGA